MQKAKKICCTITPRRIMGGILIAATVVNLIIVGAAFKVTAPFVVPTSTPTQTIPTGMVTFPPPTATEGSASPVTTTVESLTQTPTFTLTPSPTPTNTATSTFTDTPSPSPTACVPIYGWPIYVVQYGEWLLAIARATGSTDEELIRANCLLSTVIYPGQKLYVPRLPTATPSITPITPTVVTNIPTDFQNASVCVFDNNFTLSFSVKAYDPEGIRSVSVTYRLSGYESENTVSMERSGDAYTALGYQDSRVQAETASYSIVATDEQGYVTTYFVREARLPACLL